MAQIIIAGTQSIPIVKRHWRERFSGGEIVGREEIPLHLTKTIRSNTDKLVMLETTATCGSGPHSIKAGQQAYDLGPKPKGYGRILLVMITILVCLPLNLKYILSRIQNIFWKGQLGMLQQALLWLRKKGNHNLDNSYQ